MGVERWSVAAVLAASMITAGAVAMTQGSAPPAPAPAPPAPAERAPSPPAQDAAKPPAESAPKPGAEGAPKPPGERAPKPRTLDDLLGITPTAPAEGRPRDADGAEAPSGTPPAAVDGARDRLDRTLREDELEDAFTRAVELMKQSADRLGPQADAGIETQRLQEDAVRRLDSIIDAAKKKRQQQQSQRSSSRDRQSASQDPQQRDEPSPPDKAAPSRRDQASAGERRPRGAQPGQPEPPGLEEGELDEIMHEGRVEWGNLPERIRDLVQQGRRDRVSTLYQRLTEEYYRRMAEEASR